MNFIHVLILGIIEGITEFLPISSTGHLILASHLLKLEQTEFLKTFEIVIQLGAITAVVFLYWQRVLTNFELIKKILVAFIPTAIIGFFVYPFVKSVLLESQHIVVWALFLGGVGIYLFEKWYDDKPTGQTLEQMTYKQALVIGLAQSVAIVPGVSRAAATIIGGLFAGLDRKSIVEFSFLLAIPTMVGASGLDLIKSGSSITSQEYGMLGVGFVVALITAILAVKWLLKYIQSHNFVSFGIYRIILAVLFLILIL